MLKLRSSAVKASRAVNLEAMNEELKVLRDRNLDEATFEERLDVICKLGIKVYPSEDLKSMRVVCQLNFDQVQSDNRSGTTESNEIQADRECESTTECGKVLFGSPFGSIDRTPDMIFKAVFAFV